MHFKQNDKWTNLLGHEETFRLFGVIKKKGKTNRM
jgi:hypothetical protein